MRAAGVRLRRQAGRLIINSSKPLTDAQIAFIREHKSALLQQLPEHRPLTAEESTLINCWLSQIGSR